MDIKEAVHRLRLLAERETNYTKGALIHLDEARRLRPPVEFLEVLGKVAHDARVHQARADVLREAADILDKEASKP